MPLEESEVLDFALAVEWALDDKNRSRLSKEMAAFVSSIEERAKEITEQNFKNRLRNNRFIELASVSNPISYNSTGVKND